MKPLDIPASRQADNYSLSEMVLRVLWGAGQWFFRLSPRPCFGWRRFVLRCFGAKVGSNVNTYPSTQIYFPWNVIIGDWSAIGEHALIYNPGKITIGENVTISHGAHLCAGTHDYTQPDMPLLKPRITIHDHTWICADAFIGPGVEIGEGAVVGARAVVTKDVEPWTVVGGNPAQFIKRRDLLSPSAIGPPPSVLVSEFIPSPPRLGGGIRGHRR